MLMLKSALHDFIFERHYERWKLIEGGFRHAFSHFISSDVCLLLTDEFN